MKTKRKDSDFYTIKKMNPGITALYMKEGDLICFVHNVDHN